MTGPAGLVEIGPALLPLVAVLHAGAFPEEPWSEAALAGLWANPGGFGWIGSISEPGLERGEGFGKEEHRPAGFLLARLLVDEAEILSLGVLPEARWQGLGGRLLVAGLESARRLGARRMHLEVAEDNLAARALYRRGGFREVGRRRGYYRSRGGRTVDALLLARPLDT